MLQRPGREMCQASPSEDSQCLPSSGSKPLSPFVVAGAFCYPDYGFHGPFFILRAWLTSVGHFRFCRGKILAEKNGGT